MKSLRERLNGVVICLFELVVGVLLLLDPARFATAIIIAAGTVLIVLGVVNCVRYIRTDARKAARGQFLTKGLVAILAGGFCVADPQWFIVTFADLTAIYGVAILLSAMVKIQISVDMLRAKRTKRYLAVLSALLSLACAIIILMRPFATTVGLWRFTGVTLMMEAVLDALVLIISRTKVAEVGNQNVQECSDGKSADIELTPEAVTPIRTVDERLMSYNIEMTEVTGGTFWKAYTPGQVAGTEDFFVASSNLKDFTAMTDLMQYYPPIDLHDERLRERAKALGPAWVRVSGTWATKTYYDFEGMTGGKAPEGYASILTKEQWIGVLEFVKAVGAKLLVSVSNCAGDHPGGGPLDLAQVEKLFRFSHEYGVDIAAAEFMNEPNMLEMSGAPAGYTAADYGRDQDIFADWVRNHYPGCLVVGPCSLGDGPMGHTDMKSMVARIGVEAQICTANDLLSGTKVPLDVFSYHGYNGISERLALMMPDGHWSENEAHTDAYLSLASENAKIYAPLRDRYVQGGQMWVTESGDAVGGGNTWASTYLDVLRTLNELGCFAAITDGVIFHNTLASSDYGFLEHGSFKPRPNYFAVLLWNRLMGTTVYDCGNPNMEGAHVYCHSRKDRKPGVTYLIINNSLTKETSVRLPKAADRYTLSAETMRSTVMQLNGKDLTVTGAAYLPDLRPEKQDAGLISLAPGSCTFLVM